ncbi:MAG: hypothetical protein A2X12_10495 [Bacteroidetes bacterium GWE2_29_8]|nr:MAG: hypothetical protein A2X12_10495 [Bacteroidetes bacterium GWE2_29_8]OFY23215.1 MAG: hypothetical protein A2X02_09470 [Bacteroidetes bacterium GWF2_29_10]
MDLYIKSLESISPQDTFDKSDAFPDFIERREPYFTCITPDFKKYIDNRMLRRMTKILRFGVATAKLCLDNANVMNPDAIVIGTGLGCLEDTVKFLKQIIVNEEYLLNPTSFIQSTHNTVSGQIALLLGCKNYNLTFTQSDISFENALIDAIMLLRDGDAENVLVGGIDEIVGESYELINASRCYKHTNHNRLSSDMFTLGEGATFFVISNNNSADCKCKIIDLNIINNIIDLKALHQELLVFLDNNAILFEDIDFVVSGINGLQSQNYIYNEFNSWFSNSNIVCYKSFVGEFDTAVSFGMYLGSKIIIHNNIPDKIILNRRNKINYSKGLVFNYTKDCNCSFILLSKC